MNKTKMIGRKPGTAVYARSSKRKLTLSRFVLLTFTLLLMTAIAVLPSCTEGDSSDITDTTGNTEGDTMTEPNETTTQTVEIAAGDAVLLTSGRSELTVTAEATALKINTLTTESGKNTVAAPTAYRFPGTLIKDNKDVTPTWTFRSAVKTVSPDITEAVFTYADEASGCDLTVRVIAHTKVQGPFEFVTEVSNRSSADIRMNPGAFASASFDVGSAAMAWTIKKESGMAEGFTHYNGDFKAGQGIYVVNTAQKRSGNVWVNTEQNWNASGYLPMIYLQGKDYGVYCALEWSSGRVLWDRDGNAVTLSVDMDMIAYNYTQETDFSTKVPKDTTFLFPTVYYGAYDGDVDDGSNEFKHWFFDLKVPDTLRENENEPLTQMGCAFGTDVSMIGCESIKWEYGWWSNEKVSTTSSWQTLEGSWGTNEVRHSYYQGLMQRTGVTSLKTYGAHCRMLGLNWTVYLLLHDSKDVSDNPVDGYTEFNSVAHPDWFSDRLVSRGMGRSADLGNEEVVEYLKVELERFFKDNMIGTWRTDFEPISRSSNLKNRHDANGTDVMYWCTVGFRDVVTHLNENVKGFRYESCSSGGSMKDLFTATVATVINCDDCANYLSLRTTFYDSSYVIHPTQLQLPMNSNFFDTRQADFYPKVSSTCTDEDYDFHETMLDMGFRSCIVGPPMMGSWNGVVLHEKITEYAMMYREKIRPIQRNGELYHILPRPDGTNWDGIMYADPDADNEIKGVVFLFKPSEKVSDTYNVVLDGLDPNVTYQLTFEDRPEQNCTAKGSVLMSDGVDIFIKSIGSEMIWITEA